MVWGKEDTLDVESEPEEEEAGESPPALPPSGSARLSLYPTLPSTQRAPPNKRTRMANRINTVVIGAGVVGLAVARRLARSGREVVVLEANRGIGMETSSRNSEVVHAGIYYAPGSTKSKVCVDGNRMLYDYCESRGVPFNRCGKLIVATEPGQERELEGIKANAEANGA